MTDVACRNDLKQKPMRYAVILRCLGQRFETMPLKALEIRTHGDDLIVQGWHRGTSMAMDFEEHFSADDLHRLNAEGRARRGRSTGRPDPLSLSQVLRFAGDYVDRAAGRLMRVSWQDQSDRIQAITLQWETRRHEVETMELQPALIEELCVHIYKQRKKMNLASERQPHRPFVNVARRG